MPPCAVFFVCDMAVKRSVRCNIVHYMSSEENNFRVSNSKCDMFNFNLPNNTEKRSCMMCRTTCRSVMALNKPPF